MLVVATAVAAMPAADNSGEGVMATALNFVKECGESDLSLCIKVSNVRGGLGLVRLGFFFGIFSFYFHTDGFQIDFRDSWKLFEIL